ncbi:pyridoxal phosphate-dependent aminotransferase [Rickettsiella endosymbiont of Dermanyssus gallinae]|uniref:pyridoxal phosphate-dependent aminotransferase n=1 Tax=Rickettsiella endosymbiont of Dermanyssus gallinae TaxID=2856608 RepID=UPI001C527AEC|nr:pyridoxal phosphate-dependent aminotransferase [Rickettsiella endosymbiont of Dermanyssus gallinae]
MKITLSRRVAQIKPSPTLSLSAAANRLKASGRPIINLTVGEPDFDTPEFIKQAAHQALDQGCTKYTAVDGIASLKQAIIDKFKQENKLSYEANQIIVSSGAKQCIYNLMQALLNPGDEVIIPAPYWVSYPDMALMAEAKPVFISTTIEQHLKITATQLAQAITPKTRLLIINSPSNPSGMVYTREELTELAAVLLKNPQVFILTDDIYEHIYWGEQAFENIVNVCPELYERTIVLNGCSKAYAMTGWRIGYAAGAKEIIQAMTNIQSQSTSNPNSIAQVAAKAALTGNQDCVREMNKVYQQRHQFFSEGLNDIPGVNCLAAMGAFYCFPSFSHFIGEGKAFNSDYELADYLLNKADIATVPGSAFGAPGHLRLSFATDEINLKNALVKLKEALNAFK